MELLKPQELGSRAELKEALSQHEIAVEVGCDSEGIRKFYLLVLDPLRKSMSIGLCSQGHGPPPQFLLVKTVSCVFVGFNSTIVCVDFEARAEKFRASLNGVFYFFHYAEGDNCLIVVHELGALCLELQGTLRWSIETDVIERTEIKNHSLILQIAGASDQIVVDLQSGTTL